MKQANRLHILHYFIYVEPQSCGSPPRRHNIRCTINKYYMPAVTTLLALRVCISPQHLSRKDTCLTIHGRGFCLLNEGIYRHRKYMYWHPTIINSMSKMILPGYSARAMVLLSSGISNYGIQIFVQKTKEKEKRERQEGPLGKSVLRGSFVATSKRLLLYNNDTSQTRKKTHRI